MEGFWYWPTWLLIVLHIAFAIFDIMYNGLLLIPSTWRDGRVRYIYVFADFLLNVAVLISVLYLLDRLKSGTLDFLPIALSILVITPVWFVLDHVLKRYLLGVPFPKLRDFVEEPIAPHGEKL